MPAVRPRSFAPSPPRAAVNLDSCRPLPGPTAVEPEPGHPLQSRRRGCNSVARVLASQAESRGFESLHPLEKTNEKPKRYTKKYTKDGVLSTPSVWCTEFSLGGRCTMARKGFPLFKHSKGWAKKIKDQSTGKWKTFYFGQDKDAREFARILGHGWFRFW